MPKAKKLQNWKTKVQLISLTYQLATTFKHVTFIHMPYGDCLTKCNWSRFTKLPKSQYELKRLKLCVSFQQSQPEQMKGSRALKKSKNKNGRDRETDKTYTRQPSCNQPCGRCIYNSFIGSSIIKLEWSNKNLIHLSKPTPRTNCARWVKYGSAWELLLKIGPKLWSSLLNSLSNLLQYVNANKTAI